MKKNKNIVKWILIILIVGVIVYLFIKKIWPLIRPLPKEIKDQATGEITPTTNDNWPLKKGSVGNNVKQLQISLNNMDINNEFEKLTIDRIFGPKTEQKLFIVSKKVFPGGLKQITKEQLIELESKLLS